MRIGIIVHSYTGNTYSVAQAIQEKLSAAGHSVSLERITASDEEQRESGKVQLIKKPEVDEYDVLIFGAPVRGFSLSPAMTAYLERLKIQRGKKAACFLTQFFPLPAMGGKSSMGQMKKLCSSKGIMVCGTGIVNWSNINRKRRITDIADRFSVLFQ